jgi:uroporphyrin-3 C-methyltransferase/uroporphyrinogen III methyltransferase/synthase
MNELPTSSKTSSDTAASSVSASSAPETSPPNHRPTKESRLRPQAWAVGAIGLLALLLVGVWWNTQQELGGLRQDMAQRLKSGETTSAETKALVRSVQDMTKEMQARLGILENNQIEAQSQQVALEQLYQEMSRSRDEWALAEIEQVLSTASEQLQLAGNVQGALIALQNADSRLARLDKPQFLLIRRAIARDLDRLQALPAVDFLGIALRLDTVISQVGRMPLLADEKPAVPATPPKESRRAAPQSNKPNATSDEAAHSDWIVNLENTWNSWSSEFWSEVKQLIRVRNVETPAALMLSPNQAYFVRENLKLRLLSARLALMARNEVAFRGDLSAAQDAITQYFDTRARQTQTTLELLRQVQGSDLSIEMPSLAESLTAVRNYKAR